MNTTAPQRQRLNSEPTVYIVDDNEAVRDAIRWLVEQVGLPARVFISAKEFLDAYQPDMTGCLVLDMRMPGMTGLELYEALVASGDGIPTVLITAHPEEVTQSRAREAGVTCYLSKPFAPDDLLGCVGAALARSRAGPIPKS